MRSLAIACFGLALAAPTHAWEAGRDGAICTLTHSEGGLDLRLTFDPAAPLYTLTATRSAEWPVTGIFGIAFLGGDENTITTNRHVLSDDGRSLSVADSGFGNVLAGLSGNRTAILFTGDDRLPVTLDGAAPEVAAFEACGTTPVA